MQPEQYNDRDNTQTSSTNPPTENSPNNPIHDHDGNLINRVNSETDVNELDKIFCDKNANSATSDNDDSRSIPGIEDSDIGDDIANDDHKDSNSLQTSNTANTNPNLDSNVYSDVDRQHQQHQQQHQEVRILFIPFEKKIMKNRSLEKKYRRCLRDLLGIFYEWKLDKFI